MATWGPTRETFKTASRKTWGPGLENSWRRCSTVAFRVGSMVARSVMASGGSERGGKVGDIDHDSSLKEWRRI
ncbi:hypothetical protein D0Y65_025783 [Glycine soja]|uniref:Uncharacterized protein n=1 Tax=Glycine soja TaxID=3848 RepID=A0A445IGQ9_GLYSO|nr:hypothetical protein D0Y65_025783 [Glycine soja]